MSEIHVAKLSVESVGGDGSYRLEDLGRAYVRLRSGLHPRTQLMRIFESRQPARMHFELPGGGLASGEFRVTRLEIDNRFGDNRVAAVCLRRSALPPNSPPGE